MNSISFMTANYVGRQTGYPVTWEQGEQATSAYFKPGKTFAARLERWLTDIQALGFAAIDLWSAMLDPRWATDRQLDDVVDLLDEIDLSIVSYAGWLGATLDDFERSCEIASALNIPLLAGSTPLLRRERAVLVDMLHKYGLRFALENEAERTPEEILSKLRGDADVIGVCLDTGWFGTYDYDAAETLLKVGRRLFHVHLKDVLRVGDHETCRYGVGVVPIQVCVQVLREIGYTSAISIEHETAQYDPSEDCRANRDMLEAWLRK